MKLLNILPILLTSCMGVQKMTFNENGSIKTVTQYDAMLARGEASAREVILPGGGSIRSVQQNFDATDVAKVAMDDALAAYGLNWVGKNQNVINKGDSAAKVKGTKDPNIIPKDPNVIPKDPNVIPVNPNIIK